MNPDGWQVLRFTLETAFIAVALITPLGVWLAWLLARREWRGKALVETVATLPLVMPPVATGLILLKLFGRRGPIGSILEGRFGWDVIFTWKAVVLAMGVMSFPLLMRTARTAFELVDPRLEQVARSLGAGPWRVFWTVTLPLGKRGVSAGFVLAFARALGEFGATVLVAGNIPGRTTTLAVDIFQMIELGKDDEAARLMGISLFLAFLAIGAAGFLSAPHKGKKRWETTGENP
jgi:molybdate transport system permease protein